MKTCKKFTFKNVIKLLLVLTISLSSLSLFACKQEEPTITTSITFDSYYSYPSIFDGVVLNDENPNQTVTVSTETLVLNSFKFRSKYSFYRSDENGTNRVVINDGHLSTDKYRKIRDCISYSYEDDEGNLVDGTYLRANNMFNFSETIYRDAEDNRWDYSSCLKETSKKHVLKYKIDKSKFPEVYGKAPYAEQYIEYSLTILVEDTTGDKEVEFKIDGATQVENLPYYDTDHKNFLYTKQGAKTYICEIPSTSNYAEIQVNAVDKETGTVLATEPGIGIWYDAIKITDNNYMTGGNSISTNLYAGFYVCRLIYEGSETHQFHVEYVYIYVYKSL